MAIRGVDEIITESEAAVDVTFSLKNTWTCRRLDEGVDAARPGFVGAPQRSLWVITSASFILGAHLRQRRRRIRLRGVSDVLPASGAGATVDLSRSEVVARYVARKAHLAA